MTPRELKELQNICTLFHKLEHFSADAKFASHDLDHLKRLILNLQETEDPILKKLSRYADHLNAEMSLRHLVTIMVPFERLMNRSVQDDDILIHSQDTLDKMDTPKLPLVFVLDNFRSAFNTGSIFRTADGLGIEKIYLCGYTPTPENEKVRRTTLGADKYVPWEEHKDIKKLLHQLKYDGYQIIAIETSDQADEIQEPFIKTPTAFVFGNERFGLEADLLKLCDASRKIPMAGIKNSLNVAVCAAISTWEWKRQWLNSK